MSASQATSLSTPLTPVDTARVLPMDERPRDGGVWQQAFQAATPSDVPAPGGVNEAARMLALGNLALTPAPAAPFSLEAHALGVPVVPSVAAYATPGVTTARARVDSPGAPTTPPAEVASELVPGEAQHEAQGSDAAVAGTSGARAGREAGLSHAAARLEAPQRADVLRQSVSLRASSEMAVAAAHRAVANYAAAMSAVGLPDCPSDFSLSTRSSTLPVRVHVQWRERVADVWIGLHRQALDQLPDIRAGVEDWVASRGGVLGHVVCNGEVLARVAPSVSFLGAL